MLYKKNREERLSPSLFAHPTAEYRAAPFWAFNDKLDHGELRREIGAFAEMGFGGFHMHVRSGLAVPYLSREFFSYIHTSVNEAKARGMLAYLYDEDRWPSGAAGSLVTRTPRYRQKALVFASAEDVSQKPPPGRWGLRPSLSVIAEGAENHRTALRSPSDRIEDRWEAIRECEAEGRPYLLAAYDIILSEDGRLVSAEIIPYEATPRGRKWLAYVYTYPLSRWFNGATYLDTLSREAVAEFLRVTHERYAEELGGEFGGTVPAIFTDEPQMAFSSNMPSATGTDAATMPYTTDLPLTFRAATGLDLVPHIPEIFMEPKTGTVRVRYLALGHTCDRFTEAYSAQYGAWCRRHGIALTGHMMYEPTLTSQTVAIGEAMRAYGHFDIPGIDMLCDAIELNTAKQAGSAVNQYGKEGMLSELYGVTGWEFDFRGHKLQGDWQAALGVSLRVPHLAHYSLRGSAKRDYPAAISHQSAWYREYSYIEDHFARVNTAMTRGEPVVRVAVLHPIESYFLAYGPEDITGRTREGLEESFRHVTEWLLRGTVDFDFLSEATLPSLSEASETATLAVGRMRYEAVVIPPVLTLRRTTVDRLLAFVRGGGRLIVLGDAPLVDAEEGTSGSELYALATRIPMTANSLLSALSPHRDLEIVKKTLQPHRDHIYRKRRDGDCEWVFIAHLASQRECPAEVSEGLILRFRGRVRPTLYDTMTGAISPVPYRFTHGVTEVDVTLSPCDSLLFCLEPAQEAAPPAPTAPPRPTVERLALPSRVSYTLSEDNVLVLDMAEWSEDGVTWQAREELLRIDLALRRRYGYPRADGTDMQPWVIGEEQPGRQCFLRFRFRSSCAVPCRLAYEEALAVTLNGREVPLSPGGSYIDAAIRTLPLPPLVRGENELVILAPLGKRVSLENYFLLGEFGVTVEGTEARITSRPRTLTFGSLTERGLPFYGAAVTYRIPFTLREASDIRIRTGRYEGAVIAARVDGRPVGRIAFHPYTLTVEGLSGGRHLLELMLYATRVNTFGPHHAFGGVSYKGPMSWYTSGDSWSYEYGLHPVGLMRTPVIEVLARGDR